MLYFVLVFLTVYIAKRQVIQSQILSETTKELQQKTAQLGETNSKLHDSLVRLEEMTALKERNRIAREIHDTVGHTLTTVLIGIEAGKRLIKKNPQYAEEKFELAQEQVRKGLNDIRQSVRTLNAGNDILSLIPSIQSLIKVTEKHTDVRIEFDYDSDLNLTGDQVKVIYNAFEEGLTNGIRHGHCSLFVFSLKRDGSDILFRLKDNGCGCMDMNPGFGLTAMKERVAGTGGNLYIESIAGEGFCLNIRIPMEEGAFGGDYQNSCS